MTSPTGEAAKAVSMIEAAEEMVSALCQGDRRWRMSVPAQDDDPDLVISRALAAAKKEIAVLSAEVKRLSEYPYPGFKRDQELAQLHRDIEELAALPEQGAAE